MIHFVFFLAGYSAKYGDRLLRWRESANISMSNERCTRGKAMLSDPSDAAT